MIRVVLLLAAFISVLMVHELRAEIFQFIDDDGARHFVDDLSLVPEKYRNQLKDSKPLPDISTSAPVDTSVTSAITPASIPVKKEKRQTKEVEVFMTSWCQYCRKLIAFLDSKGIAYTKYDIEKNKDAKREYTEIGGSGVPLTRIGNRTIRGYNPEAIMKIVYE